MSKFNVASVSRFLIQKAYDEGKTISNEDLATKVVEIFKGKEVEVKTSASCIAWYKSKMRKEGLIGQSAGAKSIEVDLDSIEL